jgi:hypothetical protein
MNVAPLEKNQMSAPGEIEQFQYRAVSKSAVACMAFAVMSVLLAFVSELFVVLPMLGVAFGLAALSAFRKYPGELVGKPVAMIGFFLSLILLVSSAGYHTWVYATEVPEGYTRISYADLKPGPRSPTPFAKQTEEFDGQKVFLKGYVRPGDKQRGLKNFILVGDFGSCCFGGNPKITDIVAVNIISDDTVDYSLRKRRIGGEFRLHKIAQRVDEKDIPQIYYEIIADYIQ